jgi:hypothetical protein
MFNKKRFQYSVLAVGTMGLLLGVASQQAQALEPITRQDVNGYSNGQKYDDMYDDKYTKVDEWQNKAKNGWNASQDTDAGYRNGIKYDDVKDDAYTDVDHKQDKVSGEGEATVYEAYYFPQASYNQRISATTEIDYE